jgi:eukaryotic-like serine/threonine-protein kinase
MADFSPKQVGKYELVSLISSGGMGEIYLAKQYGIEGFNKLVAIKTLQPHLSDDQEFVTMFLDEARLAARLTHGNIAEIYDLVFDEGDYYIVMEYVQGEDLETILDACKKKNQDLPNQLAVRIIERICEGLGYAHTKTDVDGNPLEVVHRDISPQNIMVTFSGAVKIIDFGIAKSITHRQRTRTNVIKGKHSYMSPEQCRGLDIDARSDIFSLGIVFWELITGERLYNYSTEIRTQKEIAQGVVTHPSSVNEKITEPLEEIVLKALRKSPQLRYQTAYELQNELEAYLEQRGLHCSTPHLATFMEDLFQDRPDDPEQIETNSKSESPTKSIRLTDIRKPNELKTEDRPSSGNCPKCRIEEMRTESIEGVEIDRCPACQGIFLDSGELAILLRNKLGEKADNPIFVSTPEILDSAKAICLRCNQEMELVQAPFAIFVDVCHNCGGIFLDAGELSSLQRLPSAIRLR